jgi:hypothetical protein
MLPCASTCTRIQVDSVPAIAAARFPRASYGPRALRRGSRDTIAAPADAQLAGRRRLVSHSAPHGVYRRLAPPFPPAIPPLHHSTLAGTSILRIVSAHTVPVGASPTATTAWREYLGPNRASRNHGSTAGLCAASGLDYGPVRRGFTFVAAGIASALTEVPAAVAAPAGAAGAAADETARPGVAGLVPAGEGTAGDAPGALYTARGAKRTRLDTPMLGFLPASCCLART